MIDQAFQQVDKYKSKSSIKVRLIFEVCILWLAGTYSEHLRQVRLPTLVSDLQFFVSNGKDATNVAPSENFNANDFIPKGGIWCLLHNLPSPHIVATW